MESAVSCDLIQNDRGAPMSPCTCHDLPLPFPGSLRPISCHNNAGGDVLETAMEAIGSLHTISPVMTSPRDAASTSVATPPSTSAQRWSALHSICSVTAMLRQHRHPALRARAHQGRRQRAALSTCLCRSNRLGWLTRAANSKSATSATRRPAGCARFARGGPIPCGPAALR